MVLILCVLVEDDGIFEVIRKIQPPVWIPNSVYVMDHDSEGRCYCGSFFYA
jgi:hypothetical protein